MTTMTTWIQSNIIDNYHVNNRSTYLLFGVFAFRYGYIKYINHIIKSFIIKQSENNMIHIAVKIPPPIKADYSFFAAPTIYNSNQLVILYDLYKSDDNIDIFYNSDSYIYKTKNMIFNEAKEYVKQEYNLLMPHRNIKEVQLDIGETIKPFIYKYNNIIYTSDNDKLIIKNIYNNEMDDVNMLFKISLFFIFILYISDLLRFH